MITDSLLIRFISGEAKPNEQAEVERWLGQGDPDNLSHYKAIRELYEEKTPEPDIIQDEMQEDWNIIENKIRLSENIEKAPSGNFSKWLYRAAAVIILAIGTTLILDLQRDTYTIRGKGNEATVSILPDGSQVLLSKGARLTYSKEFNQENRVVSVSGEAFFNVASDPGSPFIVQTGDAKIKVTGTSFRVYAPVKEDDIEVVVKSGKVLFYNSETFTENSFRVDLGPGDKGIYSPKLNQLNKTHDNKYKHLNWN